MLKLIISFILITFYGLILGQTESKNEPVMTFQIDSIHSIQQTFDSLGNKLTHLELRKARPCGMYFEYYSNGVLKTSGSYRQVADQISILNEDLLTGEITYSDQAIDNSPRKDGAWVSFDSIGRIVEIEKFSISMSPYLL